MFIKRNAKCKVVSLVLLLTMLISLLPAMPAMAYSAGDSFTIYSNPANIKNTAGRSYIWAEAPDAMVEANAGDGARARYFHAGDGIVHEPAKGSLDGLNTRVVVTHRAQQTSLNGTLKCSGHSDLAAVVTYVEDGVVKKSPSFRFTGYHYNNKQWKDCGEENTITQFDIGTYPNVVSVNVYHLLSTPLDGSTLAWSNSSTPYHENVRFEIVGNEGEAIIPVDKYYIEKDILPVQDLGIPPSTPAPTAQIPQSAGATAEPLVEPGTIMDGPVVAYGLGTSFSLFPSDENGGALNPVNYVIENAAPSLNADNGVTRYELATDASLSHSISWGINNTTLGGSTSSKVIFKPTEGRLDGVLTEVKAYSFGNGGMGLDAIVTYDGGKTETVNFLPDNYSFKDRADHLYIGTYPNLEYVTVVKRGSNEQRIPSLLFTVVNEDSNATESMIERKVYEKPNIPTVTPKPVTTIPVPTVNSPISINEAVSDNTNCYVDQYGKKSDWIELYNSSSSDVDISGYGLTDNVNKPYKWALPSGSVVPAKGYLLIIASDNDTVINGEIHANFSISKAGETLMLSDTSGEVVSVLDMPAPGENMAVARVPDGSNNIRVASTTVGASNNDATVERVIVSKPEFTAESGFYDSEFQVSITAQGGTVYYTTDGSVPTASSAAFSSPISVYNRTSEPNVFSAITYKSSTYVPSVKVDKCMVVRAVAVDDEGNCSDVVTKTYFVGLDMMEDYNNTMILSISADEADFFDEEEGMFPNYEEQRREYEKEVHLDVFDKDGSLALSQDCGARVRGYGYKGVSQKGINFYARSEYGASKFNYPLFEDAVGKHNNMLIDSYDSFAIRHGSLNTDGMRFNDGLAQYISGELGTGYQSQRPAILFLNGEYWGVYYMSERVTDDYIETHYGIKKEDAIVIKNHLNKGEAVEADRQLYESERRWLSNTDFTDPDNYAMLDAKYDIPNLMFYYATNINEENIDWIGYNFATWRSRYITDKPFEDGKWRFLTYDMDTAFNTSFVPGGYINQSWGAAIMSNPSLKKVFANILLDTANNTFSPQNTYEEMRYWFDEYYEVFDVKMRERWGNNFWVEDRILQSYGSLTSDEFVRIDKIKNAFGLTGKYVPVNVRVNNPAMGNVRINSIDHDFTKGSFSTRNFTDYTTTLLAKPNPGYKLLGWETSDGTSLTSYTDALTYATLSNNGSVITAVFGFENDEVIEISNAAELVEMASNINSQNSEYSYRKYVLTADIDMTGVAFTPIGTGLAPFNGEFDGNGYTISGITVDTTTQGAGLFGYVGTSGIVKNVGVKDIAVTSTGTDGKNVGGIVGNNKGSVENCYSTGSLSGISTVGGIVGNNSGGTVKNCYSTATVTSDSANTLGGVAGKTEYSGKIVNSYSLIEPVAKNDGGSVDTLTSIVNENDISSGYLAYMLNNNGKNAVWGQNEAPVIANDTYKAITVKVTFLEDYKDERYGYTYVGGTVALPDDSVEWELEDGTAFTSSSIVTEDTYVIRKGSSITPPTPTPEPTATPTPTAVPSTAPVTPKPTPTATPTAAPTFNPETGIEIWANPGNEYYDAAMGRASLDAGKNYDAGVDENGVNVGVMNYFNDGPDARVVISGNDTSVSFYPTVSLLDGYESDLVLTIFGEYGYAELEATITYDGGKTETVDILYRSDTDYKYYDALGNHVIDGDAAMSKPIPVCIGKYKSVESVKVRVANTATKKAGLGIYKLQFMIDKAAVAEDGISAINVENNTVKSVVVNDSNATAAKLIVGTYKTVSGKEVLTDVKIVDITSASYTDGVATVNVGLAIPDESETVKAYVLYDLSNIQPLFKNLDLEL